MRDLAKLVKEARNQDPTINGIRECIHPKKYDIVAAAVKSVAGYSIGKDSYKTPSYARNIGFELDEIVLPVKF